MISRCPTCPALFRCVPGAGLEPSPSRVLFIGGQPGKEEDSARPMFTGKTGMEFNDNYLQLAGLDRDSIRITNAMKCRNESGKKPETADVLACASYHLPDEIAQADPEVIVLMGAAACSLIPSISLDVEHGMPIYNAELFGWTGTIVPMDHPSGGMHDTSLMIPLLEDFTRLRSILDGSYKFPQNRILAQYSYVRTAQEIVDSFLVPICPIAIDMEDHAGVPFSIQWCPSPGRAYMLRFGDIQVDMATDRLLGKLHAGTVLGAFESCLKSFSTTVILHNAPGDLDSMDAVKLMVPIGTAIRDTMQEAYHLGNLPQGLKALAYRLLGIRMKSWMEVVGPPSRSAVLTWLEHAYEYADAALKLVEFQQLKTKVKKVVKAHPIEKRLRAIFRYGCGNDAYPIWKHLTELQEKEPSAFASVESMCGPVPQLGIANCTSEDALEYACKDADMTLRISQILPRLRAVVDAKVHPFDRDKIAKGV